MTEETPAVFDSLPNTMPQTKSYRRKLVVLVIVFMTAIVTFIFMRQYFSLEYLSQVESNVKAFYSTRPLFVYLVAFVIYVVVTGLSIPARPCCRWFTPGFLVSHAA